MFVLGLCFKINSPEILHFIKLVLINFTTLLWLCIVALTFDVLINPLNATTPTAARTPMIATTTRSSIKSKTSIFKIFIKMGHLCMFAQYHFLQVQTSNNNVPCLYLGHNRTMFPLLLWNCLRLDNHYYLLPQITLKGFVKPITS